jgi:hypothetical protein
LHAIRVRGQILGLGVGIKEEIQVKYIKMLGLAAVVAAVLMALVGMGTASATKLYSGGGPLGSGTTLHAVLEASTVVQAGFGNIACHGSTIHVGTTNEGGATETVLGPISTLTFEACTGNTVTVLSKGALEIHHIPGTTNGTVTSSDSEWTLISHSSGVHCIYKTEGTDLGVLTGNTSGPATLDVEATIVRVPTSFLCASSAKMTAKYDVTSPSPLWVEAS